MLFTVKVKRENYEDNEDGNGSKLRNLSPAFIIPIAQPFAQFVRSHIHLYNIRYPNNHLSSHIIAHI